MKRTIILLSIYGIFRSNNHDDIVEENIIGQMHTTDAIVPIRFDK